MKNYYRSSTLMLGGFFIVLLLLPAKVVAADKASGFDSCSDFYSFASDRYKKSIENSGSDYDTRLVTMKAFRLLLIEDAYRCRTHCESMKLMATINMEAFNNKGALEYAKAAVSADPSDPEANNILGTVYGLLGDFSMGLPYLEKAALIEPKLNRDLCSNYEMAGYYDKAIDACTKAIQAEDDRNLQAPSLYVRGRAYRSLNMLSKAEADIALAKELGFDGDQYYTQEHMDAEGN